MAGLSRAALAATWRFDLTVILGQAHATFLRASIAGAKLVVFEADGVSLLSARVSGCFVSSGYTAMMVSVPLG